MIGGVQNLVAPRDKSDTVFGRRLRQNLLHKVWGMDSIWTSELVEQLSALWKQGLSTAEIGRKLGISKNAVVGKAHRLMLTPRPSPLKSPPIRHVAGKAGPTCSWPHGHPGQTGFRFCGKRVVPGKPYCPEHAAMAYIQPKERKVQAA